MARMERSRETLSGSLDQQYLREKVAAGWKPVAIEWERPAEESLRAPERPFADVPYGLQVAADCRHLEENSDEMQVLKFVIELIVQDISLPRMAEELNRKGHLTREGTKWGPVEVFKILNRVIEVTPRIFHNSEWEERRKQIARVSWNS